MRQVHDSVGGIPAVVGVVSPLLVHHVRVVGVGVVDQVDGADQVFVPHLGANQFPVQLDQELGIAGGGIGGGAIEVPQGGAVPPLPVFRRLGSERDTADTTVRIPRNAPLAVLVLGPIVKVLPLAT